MSRNSRHAGDVYNLVTDEGNDAWAVMLEDPPFVAFYANLSSNSKPNLNPRDLLFIVGVTYASFENGGWGDPVLRLNINDIPQAPTQFKQDILNLSNITLVEPNGVERPGSYDDAVGLEAVAAWSSMHILSRIDDALAGRENKFEKTMRVKPQKK